MPTIDKTTSPYHDSSAQLIRKVGTYTGPASYVTGGDACTAGDFGFGRVRLVLFEPFSNGTVIVIALYDYTNSKVKFFDLAGNEIANGTALSTYTARFEAFGI